MTIFKMDNRKLEKYKIPCHLKIYRLHGQRIMSKENSVIFFGFQTDHESHKYLKIICVVWGALPKRIFRWKK